jgi:hypothetical protein
MVFLPAFFICIQKQPTGLCTIRIKPIEEIDKIWRVENVKNIYNVQ